MEEVSPYPIPNLGSHARWDVISFPIALAEIKQRDHKDACDGETSGGHCAMETTGVSFLPLRPRLALVHCFLRAADLYPAPFIRFSILLAHAGALRLHVDWFFLDSVLSFFIR